MTSAEYCRMGEFVDVGTVFVVEVVEGVELVVKCVVG